MKLGTEDEKTLRARWMNIIHLTLKPRYFQNKMDEKFKSIFCRNFGVISSLGGGSFGLVYKVEKYFCSGNQYDVIDFHSDGYDLQKYFAIKLVPNYTQQMSMNELKHLSALIHPNIVRCHNAWVEIRPDTPDSTEEEWIYLHHLTRDRGANKPVESVGSSRTICVICNPRGWSPGFMKACLFLQYELCGDGNLEELLKDRMIRNARLAPQQETINSDYEQSQRIFSQVLEGLVYIEYNGIVHGDLKPNNIFLVKHPTGLQVKIGDFGLSMRNEEVFAVKNPKDFRNVEIDPLTPRQKYHAPEYLKGVYEIKGDIYALGLIFMTMLGQYKAKIAKDGNYSFTDRQIAVLDAMYSKQFRKYPKDLPLQFPVEFDWITKMTSHTQSKRPLPSQLKTLIAELKSDQNAPSETEIVISQKLGNYLKNEGGKLPEEMLLSLQEFPWVFVRKNDFKKAYLYLVDFFYEGFKILRVSSPYMLHKFETLVRIGMILGRLEDIYYVGCLFLPRLEEELGQDDPRTLKAQMCFFVALKKLSLFPETPHSPPNVTKNCRQLKDKIFHSPAFIKLPHKDPLRLECIVYKGFHELESEDRNELTDVLLKVEEVIDIHFESDDEDQLLSDFILKAKLLGRLNRITEADEFYSWVIERSISKFGFSRSDTFILITGYGDFLTELGQFDRARPYREARCGYFQRRDHLIGDSIESLEHLVLVYDKLGLTEEVDFVIRYYIYQYSLRNALYMFETKEGGNSFISALKSRLDGFVEKARLEYGLCPCTRFYQSAEGRVVGYDETEHSYGYSSNLTSDPKCHRKITDMAREYWDHLQKQKSAFRQLAYPNPI